MSRAPDLTKEEQAHVRTALRFLRARCGGWVPLAKALGFAEYTLCHATGGKKSVTASMAVRAARFVGISIDDMLAGKYPPAGACPHCGHIREEGAA